VASKTAQNEQEKAEVIEELLDHLDSTLDRVKVLYEQFFLGMQKQPPAHLHTDVERKLRDLTQMQIRNTALRYRFATLQQKFGSYNTYWRRTLRQIENGTYARNLAKIGRQAALTGEEIPDEILAAMPKRMREQVKRDREAVLARRALREQTDSDVDIDVDDLVAVKKAQKKSDGAFHLDESDADLDMDALFRAVTNDDGTNPDAEAFNDEAPTGPARIDEHADTPVSRRAVPRSPTFEAEQATDHDLHNQAPRTVPPTQHPNPAVRAAVGMRVATPPAGVPTAQRMTPTGGMPAIQRPTSPGMPVQRPGTPDPSRPTSRPATPLGLGPQRPSSPQQPSPSSGVPVVQRPTGGMPAIPPPASGGFPTANQSGPNRQPSGGFPAAGQSGPNRQPSGGFPAAGQSGPNPSGQSGPNRSAPSQGARPLPVMPGAASARGPVPVESMSGPFPREQPKPQPNPTTRTAQGIAPVKPPPPPQTTKMKRVDTAPGVARMAPPPGMTDADVNTLYANYVKAKEAVGEKAGPGSYGKLLQTINAQAPKIMEQYKSKGVDFQVVVKDNQVVIRAKPKP